MNTFNIDIFNIIINIFSLIFIPIFSVWLAQHLSSKSKSRDDKMNIFKILMTHRSFVFAPDAVYNYNLIECVFYEDKKVIEAWREYFKLLKNPVLVGENEKINYFEECEKYKCKLLKEMACCIGYKKFIVDILKEPAYFPDGMRNEYEENKNIKDNMNEFIKLLLEDRKNAINTQEKSK